VGLKANINACHYGGVMCTGKEAKNSLNQFKKGNPHIPIPTTALVIIL
jgi:hypothetical protein